MPTRGISRSFVLNSPKNTYADNFDALVLYSIPFLRYRKAYVLYFQPYVTPSGKPSMRALMFLILNATIALTGHCSQETLPEEATTLNECVHITTRKLCNAIDDADIKKVDELCYALKSCSKQQRKIATTDTLHHSSTLLAALKEIFDEHARDVNAKVMNDGHKFISESVLKNQHSLAQIMRKRTRLHHFLSRTLTKE